MILKQRVHERKKTPVQLLNPFHACFYPLYKKGMTHVMISLQGLHSGDTFRHSYFSASVGSRSFCPWCLKLGRNTKTIAIYLWEVNYRMTIVCNIYKAFAGMFTQSILGHHSGCKVKHDKECREHEGYAKAHNKKSKSQGQKEASQPHGSDAAKKS